MGKVRSAKALARKLREKIYSSKSRRKVLEKYLEALKINYEKGLISYARYVEILHKKTDGRDIHELIEYYNQYEKDCKKLLKKQQKQIAKSSIATIFLILGLFTLIFATTYYIQPTFTGFATQENISEELNETFLNETSNLSQEGSLPSENITINKSYSEEINETEVLIAEETSNLSQQEPLSSETLIQGQAIIGQPVQWLKKVALEEPGIATVILPEEAENITVKKTKDRTPARVKIEKVTKELNERGSSPITGQVIGGANEESWLQRVFESIISFFRNIVFTITGQAIDNPATNNTVIEVEINDTATEYEVAYETPAPQAFEQETAKGKQIIISGPDELNYTNILAFTNLTMEAPESAIKLYHLTNNSRIIVDTVNYDNNNNGLIDYIEWNVPHLSNQTYELEITVLNVQSYPMVGGNWTVRFNTTGTSDLTITAVNGTTFGTSSPDDLEFLQLKCGDTLVNTSWINNSIFVSNYSCDNQTGFETSKVLTSGKHHLEFDFGGVKAYAHNQASTTAGGNFKGYKDTVGTNFNADGTYSALEWASQDYNDGYLTYSGSNPTRIEVDTTGDYFIALSLPLIDSTYSGSNNQRASIEAAVFVDGTQALVGTARGSYMRGTDGTINHFQTSDSLNVLVPGVSAGSYIEIYVRGASETNEAISANSNFSLYVEYVQPSDEIFFGTGTMSTAPTSNTNINQGTENGWEYDMEWVESIEDGTYTHDDVTDPNLITLADIGYYFVTVNIPEGAAATRSNIGGRIELDGTQIDGGTFMQGYIRNADTNQDSSVHWAGLVETTSTNQDLSIGISKMTTVTTAVTTDGLNATIYVRKLPNGNQGLYHSVATQVTGGAPTDWNPDTTQYAMWSTDNEKDASYYAHTNGDENITIQQEGFYLISFNSPQMTSGTMRQHPQFDIYVNGQTQEGGRAGSSYARINGGHNEATTMLTYGSHLSAGDNVSIGVVLGDATTAVTVTVLDEAALMILLVPSVLTGDPTLVDLTLDAPATDPNIFEGNTFEMSCTSETGNGEGVSLTFEYNSSIYPWKSIETSGTVNFTTDTINPSTNVVNNTQYDKTITAHTLGDYYVRCNLSNSTDYLLSSVQKVSVGGYGTLNVDLTTPLTGQITEVNQNQTFWMNTTITCEGAAGVLCGEVNATARYNESSQIFGTGADGAKTITTTNAIINNYTYLAGDEGVGSGSIIVNDGSEFSQDDEILIVQMQDGTGTGDAGTYEFVTIASIATNTFTLESNLVNSYGSGTLNATPSSATQVIRVPQYTDFTVNAGASVVAKEWDGYSGGIVVFKATDTADIQGTVNVSWRGFRGGDMGYGNNEPGWEGEGIYGLGVESGTVGGETLPTSDNNGGAGQQGISHCGGGGAGGGYATQGQDGNTDDSTTYNDTAWGGYAVGNTNFSEGIYFGGGGGGGGDDDNGGRDALGGDGGGIVYIAARNISNAIIYNEGQSKSGASDCGSAEGSGGAGGTIWLSAQTLDLDTVSAIGGQGANVYGDTDGWGGDGSDGRIRFDFGILTGASTPDSGFNGTISGFLEINTVTDTPFWTSDSQPQTCVSMVQGDTCQLNWSINATGALNSLWAVDVKFSSNYSQVPLNYSNNATINTTEAVAPSNNAPTIPYVYNTTMTDVSSGPNEGPSVTNVIINFTAYDADGFGDLDDSSAVINFTDGGTTRENASCDWVEDWGTYYANYSCTVPMWWWDGAGDWDIQAFVSDDEPSSGTNTSTNFYLGTTAGASFTPAALTWTGLNPGDSNKEPNENFLLNNTGNLPRYIELNATNLVGETNPSEALWAGNFTAKNAAGCEGTTMVPNTYVNITGLSFSPGNYTLNDGTAQEEVYVCLEEAGPELDVQTYSTSGQGSWNLRIVALLAALMIKKRKELEEELEELEIPITIFTTQLAPLESVVKYMRENLKLGYSEIANELNRDQRTIWATYNKTLQKQEALTKVGKPDLYVPISILRNRKLTALESIVIYLKEKEMKYIEIADMLNKDQRNIWTVYNRAINKGVEEKRKELEIPIKIFENKKLAPLETITKYLKENLKMGYSEIAKELNRNEKTIYTTYKKAKEKVKTKLEIKDYKIKLPINILVNRKLTALGSIIKYMKENLKMGYSEIAKELNRDQRNIWTVYSRTTKK